MDTKKLDKWAKSLLDTGKRNNLINFRGAKASTVEVLFPATDILFGKVQGTASFEVFDPMAAEEDEAEARINPEQLRFDMPEEEDDAADEKAAYLAQHAWKIKKQNQLLLYSPAVDPLDATKNISKRARQFIEETGVNVAYMAFGFIRWKESATSNQVYRAPILLVPIQINQASAAAPCTISTTDDDIVVNPTFSYKMEAEYGMKLPEYNDEGLSGYLEKVADLVKKLQWTVTAECKIGIFSFLKINMYRDLKDNEKAILANENVRRILGERMEAEKTNGNGESSYSPVANPLIDLHTVVDADSSQIEAIEMAKSGKSFVLQGPPGTGKSQTITNIIAECLSDGKKVLFVSEKLAALNVVYDKLKKAGLAEFCLQIHSHKANKKEAIADICNTLRNEKSIVSSKANIEIAEKEKAQHQLDAYATELHKPRAVIDKSLYQLYESYSAYRDVPDVEYPIAQLTTKNEVYLNEVASLLEQYVSYIATIGYDYKKNPWYGYINQDTSYQTKSEVKSDFATVSQLLQTLIPLQQEISDKYGVQCTSIEDALFWKNFFRFASTSKLITPSLLNRDCFDTVNSALRSMKTQSEDILNARSVLSSVFDDDIYTLDGAGHHKKLTKQFNKIFSRLFNAEYKEIIADLRLCKKNGKRVSYKEAVAMTERLSYYQQRNTDFAGAEAPIKAFLGEAYHGAETDWNYVLEQMLALEKLFSSNAAFGALAQYDNFAAERSTFADYYQRLDAAFAACSAEVLKRTGRCFDATILDVQVTPSVLVYARLTKCLEEMDKLDHWCHFRSLLSKMDDKQIVPYVNAATCQNIEAKYIVDAFKKQFYFQWIDSVISGNPVLSGFNRISQDKAISTFNEKDTEQFEINKARIRAKLSSTRPSLDLIAPGSSLAIILREGEKKRKQKSIRTLLGETGEFVQQIKPCFLMSPLSVSTFLSADSLRFDVAIFDEASQVFPQDAVGAIYRAKQLIVVGDSKQMPPSNFFNATIEDEDDDEEVEDVADFESILDMCSTCMQQLRLRWHYRSRYEQLIAFSNKNFYNNELVTFPSSKTDAPGIGVDYYHVDGIFNRKAHTNRKEAEYVVDLIYQNIEKYPNRSLGVVAFSVAQQDLIDTLLDKRRKRTSEKEFFFKNDGNEPFFIKNLETVQGDERDTIIFSVAYGADEQGRLLHNFGPLNRAGGERRLNVAVTRAKCNVQLVSSMHYTDIDLKHTSAQGAKLLREYLDYAENGSIALERTITVSPFEQFDSEFEMEVCDYLRSKGFTVDTQVGCSGYRIDLGLKMPNTSDYVLAIECDGATYHSSKNARDRDRLRQEILERMGWKFYRIWSTDWFRNKAIEQYQLLKVAIDAVQNPTQAGIKPSSNQMTETFEKAAAKKSFEFPIYEAVDILKLSGKYDSFKKMIKAILEVEAPLSEEWLLKRMVWYFGREKVTSAVKSEYEQKMRGCQTYGIIRRDGFLYLNNGKEIVFRAPSDDIKRDITQIAPEELAAGMLEILKQNGTVDRMGLYRSLAALCGVTRLGRQAVNVAMNNALNLLGGRIVVHDEQVSIK